MLHAMLLCAAVATASADTSHIVLVATTDVHGHATDWDYLADRPYPGGLARAATVIDSLRARYPGQVVVVDAGDLLEGDPFASYYARVAPRDPHPVIEAMNLVGYDVATPGNHEFDYGLAALDRAIGGAAFRYVSGNLRTLPAETLAHPAYVVLSRNRVRVGVAGFTTPGVMVWSRKAVQGRIRVAPIESSAARVLPGLRRASDLAIVLIHSGLGGPSSYDTTGVGGEHVAAVLAALPAKPDLVVVGHSHRELMDTVIAGVHFVQPKPFAQTLAVVHLDLVRRGAKGPLRLVRVRAESVSLAQVPPAPRLAGRQAKLRAEVLQWLGRSLGEARGAMPAALARAEPTAIMGLVDAVQRRRAGAELSAVTVFNPRAGFPDGDIRMRDVFALYPYENTLRAVRISGAQLKDYLEQSARYFVADTLGRVALDPRIPGYDYDLVGGARYDIDLRLPAGSRIRNLSVRGRAVAPSDSFTLAVNSYRQSGGGGFTALKGAPVVYDRDESVRDLLVEEIRARGRLDPRDFADADWRIVPEEAAEDVRRLFGAPPAPTARKPGETTVLRLLAIGELRGALGPRAVALKAAGDRAEADCGCPALRLAAGDLLQGTPTADLLTGRTVVEALNRLGLNATAVGARDFTWSLDTLRQRMAQSRFSWLVGNVVDSATGRRPDWAVPYRILSAGGLKVAVVGYLAPTAGPWLRAARVRGLTIERGASGLREPLKALDAESPDVTVVLAHAGVTCDLAACRGQAVELARELQNTRVDLVITGGDGPGSTRVGRVAVVQARPGAAELGVVDVVRTPVGGRELRVRLDPVEPDRLPPDSTMVALVARAQAEADSLGHRVVARIRFPLGRSEEGESPLGDLIADAQRNALRADVSLVRAEAIAADLPAGPITYWQLLQLHEPPRPLVTLTVTGAVLRQVLEQALAAGLPSVHASGVVVRYDARARTGRRVRKIELDDGRPLLDDGSYSLAVAQPLTEDPDYPMLAGRPMAPSTTTDVDALATYLGRLPQPVGPPDQIRFQETR